ncbi:MAG: hypothetical protein AAGG75_26920 [Bacteroidota bacterium]
MPNVTVNIVGGTEAQNTTAVTIGAQRWGLNGNGPFGTALPTAAGIQDLTVYKTTAPNQISIKVDVPDYDVTVNVTVDADSIRVTSI